MTRWLGLIALVLALDAPTAQAQRADLQHCANFPSQAAAQAALRRDPSDPNRLDGQGNGLACEHLPGPRDERRVSRGGGTLGDECPSCTLPYWARQ